MCVAGVLKKIINFGRDDNNNGSSNNDASDASPAAAAAAGAAASPAAAAQPSTDGDVSTSEELLVVSSMDDVLELSEVQQKGTGQPTQLPSSTVDSIAKVQERAYLDSFVPSGNEGGDKLGGGDILDGLSRYFAKYEVPLGMLNKLRGLQEYKLHFLVDDSGSMWNDTDVELKTASSHVLGGRTAGPGKMMTRWEECQNRIHTMIDIVSYVPTQGIRVSFLNAKAALELTQGGRTPEEFQVYAHEQLAKAFAPGPTGLTPTHWALSKAFRQAIERPNGKTCVYFFTDGEPSDKSIKAVCDLVVERAQPERCVLTFITCTDEDGSAEWMKTVEGLAPYCAEVDDFVTEREEVARSQGPCFPFTRGFWLLCHLVAAINPNDLDQLDELRPLSKHTLDDLLGRVHTAEEYQQFFLRNPHADLYLDEYTRLLTEPCFAADIVSEEQVLAKQAAAGYKDGKRPDGRARPGDFEQRVLAATTAAKATAAGASGTLFGFAS